MAIKINGEIFQFKGTASRADSETIIEVDNSEDESAAAQIRLTDKGETDPSGRFRLRVSGTELHLERATQANWGAHQTLLSFDTSGNGGLNSLALTEAGLEELVDQLLMHVQSGSALGLKLTTAMFVALGATGVKA